MENQKNKPKFLVQLQHINSLSAYCVFEHNKWWNEELQVEETLNYFHGCYIFDNSYPQRDPIWGEEINKEKAIAHAKGLEFQSLMDIKSIVVKKNDDQSSPHIDINIYESES
jgi:hypothetical protein